MDIKKKLREGSGNVIYTAVVLDDNSHNKLLSEFAENIPEGWKTIAHHMTISFGKSLEEVGLGEFDGVEMDLRVTHLGVSDDAIAVKVTGMSTTNKIPHITLAVPQGGSPVKSNNITNWEPIKGELMLEGTVTEIKKK